MNLSLETISLSHIEKIRKWRNEQMEALRQYRPISEEEQREYFKEIHRDHKQVLFAIKNKDTLVGYCGLVYINHVYRTSEISFLCDTLLINKGYEEVLFFALEGLCKYGFDTLNLNRLSTEVYSFREKHIELLEEFGMRHEGVLRENVYCFGQYHDSVIHSMLKSEYQKNQQKVRKTFKDTEECDRVVDEIPNSEERT